MAAAEAAANKVAAVVLALFFIQSKRQFHQDLIRLLLDKVVLVVLVESQTAVLEEMELTLLLLDSPLVAVVAVAAVVVLPQMFNQQKMVAQDLAVVELVLLDLLVQAQQLVTPVLQIWT